MIKTNTLLIVGAGASVPYGYPTGLQLKEDLCDPQKLKSLMTFVDEELIDKFCRDFSHAQRYSIDSFLSHRGNDFINDSEETNRKDITYGYLGKLAISNRLIECENLEKLLNPVDKEDHWLAYLWNIMTAHDSQKSAFKNNQLKIISFNYDRVIEQYLQTAIREYYGIDHAESVELRKHIEILHVYGILQDLEERPYSQIDDLSKPASCIKVIPENRKDSDEVFLRAKELISWANKICFIGFGFDKTNLSRLGFNGLPLSKLFGKDLDGARHAHCTDQYGFTRYKMTKSEINEVMNSLNGGYVIPRGAIRYGFSTKGIEKLKTLGYLKHINFFSEP